ncbi:MAG: hypothetical protein ACYDAQ_06760 [Mycobacteriales bacterium]
MAIEIRDYSPADEQSWLRCRVLSCLGTAYSDDVWTSKPPVPPSGLAVVTTEGSTIIEAWTQDGEASLRRYRGRGFVECDHYLRTSRCE